MNEAQRKNCESLRKMESSDALEWLLLNHSDDGCFYIPKRSWAKEDQVRLAEHFLKRIPHASAICYEALLSVMSVSKFIEEVEKYIPSSESGKKLLKYYLFPSLDKFAKTEKDQASVKYIKALI